jgi:hypothetical protein
MKNVFALTQLFENLEVAMDVGTSRLTSGKERTHMVWAKAFAARSYSYDL